MAKWVGGNRFLSMSEMQTNALYIWGYYQPQSWTLEAVSALLGNMQSESSINPNIWEGLNYGNMAGGYGLVQWTPATKYINFVKNLGGDYESIDWELFKITTEMRANEQWFYNPNHGNPPITFKEFATSTLPCETLANYFLWYYEHPYNDDQPIRAEQARYWYEFLSGKKPPPVNPDFPDIPTGHKLPYWLLFQFEKGGLP